ncbi:MAG: 30S ribosomal protein S13 [Nanoarchaeota archaeon]|nr:30S ribosomal protein S13 [Nanoarchaeota archaeon]MBU1004401.1 30S ribosomal protein S13 [Nanoarchaeota archaeon]MBU1946712.1 30S ribosomal protein S13 [Nanoarchaeota archaeon]
MEEHKDFRHIVRVANTDLNGTRPIGITLRQIKGVNFMFTNLICHLAKIDRKKRTGDLGEDELSRINNVLKDPIKSGAPSWILNRRKDPETGEDKHIITVDLNYMQDNDIKMMKKMKSYKGVRHILGQPVRGQRTKSNFRKNKGKVSLGVKTRPISKAGRV